MNRISKILIILGVVLLIIPTGINIYEKYEQRKIIEQYKTKVDNQGTTVEDSYNNLIDEMDKLVEDEIQFEKNEEFYPNKREVSELREKLYYDKFIKPKLGEAFGIIRIDKIDVEIPMIEGTEDELLKLGAGHFEITDLPGEIGNCVLAGHRSYTYGKLFNRLGEIEVGDIIEVDFNKKTYIYEVYKVHIIEPDDFSVLNRNNKDKVLTLITCHPPKVNTHRLIVHAVIRE